MLQLDSMLSCYDSCSPGVKASLYRLLSHGKLGGSGNLLILPVDQGFEHGPARSFSLNEEAYDPEYHVKLALEAGLSAYAAPVGMLEVIASKYAGKIPLILKMNSSNSLASSALECDQATTSSVKTAVRLGCVGVGFTIYPGSDNFFEMLEDVKEMIEEAAEYGLFSVVWSYPRGGDISKKGETSLDICAYAAHMACLVGAHIVKVKPPIDRIEQDSCKDLYKSMETGLLENRIRHIKQSCFAGKRLVLFSGGVSKSDKDILEDVTSIKNGGGTGSIIGRNIFQRPKEEAMSLLKKIVDIYLETV